MRSRTPDNDDLDEEIRGHLAISIRERIDRGEDPAAARLAALKEFGNVTLTRDSIQSVWRSRWAERAEALIRDIRFAIRALLRAKGLTATVVATLALGIGANAAIFSVVRGVLLRPLVNRDEDRLIYIRQSAPGLGAENMTFSVPEINEFKSRATTVASFGDFSTVDFAMTGLGGEPRIVKAGVVGGSFFEVMGLRPVLGRLLDARDDGPKAMGAAVLTYRFWTTSLNSDATVVGRTIRLGPRSATIVGVLEPSVPYPADTEIIANVVTSPHHLGATMVTGRTHRMTELFGRIAPDSSIEAARAELTAVHAAMMREHPEAYSVKADVHLRVATLRDQIASPARTILLVLLAAAAVVFVIACSNVANLILARSVRREGELTVRAALGAGYGALRRTLLAESLVLCGTGAVLGVLLAGPLVAIVSRFAARFSVRALEVHVDASVLWVGAGLAMAAAVLLAFVPRLPSPHAPAGLGLTSGVRITPGTNRRLRLFATAQIAFSFVLLAAAGMLLTALIAVQSSPTGYNMRQVIAFDIPTSATGMGGPKVLDFYDEVTRRISQLPGVAGVAVARFSAVARCRQLRSRLPVLGRGIHARRRRRGSDWATAPCLAGAVRRARRHADRRSRIHSRGPGGQRTRVDYQPERGTATVPERRGAEPAHVVDGSVLRETGASPHRGRRRGRGRRARGAASRVEHLHACSAGRARRAPLREGDRRSVHARAHDHARDS